MKKVFLITALLLLASKTNAQITVTDISHVQQDSTFLGKKVAVIGIVTATTGIFHPEMTYIEDQNGGLWSGIVLWDQTANFFAEEGDQLRIIGMVTNFME